MSLPSSGGGRSTNTLLALALLILIALSVYSIYEQSASQSQIAFLQQQNYALQNNLITLQNEIGSLQAQVNSLSQGTTPGPSFQVASACLSLTAGCYGQAYYIIVSDKGPTSVPKGYSVFLSFKDSTRSTYFGFNVSLPQDLTPSQGVTLEASSWPAGSGAEAKISQGDQVGVAVVIGATQASTGTHVLSCSQYTTTTTYQNITI
ncbi:MAG: hypothetical protein OK436_05670, partial [Thaumarchaeota archaeon]|nr:hypothetical protein [Nitrososphaerota archaeon]